MRSRLIKFLRAHRVPQLVILDSLAWIAAFYVAAAVRLESWHYRDTFQLNETSGHIPLYGVLLLGISAAVLHCLLAWVLRLHQGRSNLGSFEEVFVLASVVVFIGIVLTTLNAIAPDIYLARTTPLMATAFALLFMGWPRALWRVVVRDARGHRYDKTTTPVLIIGAGDGGQQIIGSMQRDPDEKWKPVGVLDDDKRRRHYRHRGVAVLGRPCSAVPSHPG